MLSHIQQGDLYEANFCMEFYAENIIDPLDKFLNSTKFLNLHLLFFKTTANFAFGVTERYLKRGRTLFHNL
jgi:para-aminobenzoate synthetase component 1